MRRRGTRAGVVAIDLSGTVAVVTGAARGIGRAIARRLTARGAAVVLVSRSRDRLLALAAELEAEGGRAMAQPADVADETSVRDLFRAVADRFGVVHYLANCAGQALDLPIAEMGVDAFRTVVESHLLGTFLCSKAAVDLMPAGGRILNFGAATGLTGRAKGANYCAAKAGVMALTKCFAIEYAPHIAVNCLVPGWTETEDIVARFGLNAPERRRRLETGILLGRLAQPEEIADWAVWLLAEAPYATGQLYFVNGGSFLA
jgi:3-oxoacyl-[acyl-carrier protein] reductase